MNNNEIKVNEIEKSNEKAVENAAQTEKVKAFSKKVADVKEQLSRDVVGQSDIIENVIIAIILTRYFLWLLWH